MRCLIDPVLVRLMLSSYAKPDMQTYDNQSCYYAVRPIAIKERMDMYILLIYVELYRTI